MYTLFEIYDFIKKKKVVTALQLQKHLGWDKNHIQDILETCVKLGTIHKYDLNGCKADKKGSLCGASACISQCSSIYSALYSIKKH